MGRETVAGVAKRLNQFEVREAAQSTLSRYMDLCDVPRSEFLWEEMAALFTADAVWEGIGPEYTGKFGQLKGRETILSMLAEYLPPSPHFRRNIHLLGHGQIAAADSTATGQWIMQQLSEYEAGGTELISARLTVDFEYADGRARISHFRTEKLFTADLAATAINA
ncbi:nuclear transport factor 2 family protein [Arthrobacter sp. ISL-28]|uniref:nuclear transport factor 2 family protein n=1 Tax=Arthrobacter sp. ISL-28 TaxID=2819108 RepID=UPI001BEC2363|nr:nuclear transport factor 2 family protein [Arthrobacter sp. ISL-28]MBT2522569.1 nuclear transport factor 2 family protein [Arthrobacter sp. ISL-28]